MKSWISVWMMVNGGVIGAYTILLFVWQVFVLRGRQMQNPDGSADNWKAHESYYGIALADVLLACPVCLAAAVLAFIAPKTGAFLLGVAGFWLLWANFSTSATSLRFRHPKLTIAWWITFPFGGVIGLSAFVLAIVAGAAS